MTEADLSAPRHTKIGVFALVALLHVLAVLALIRAFAPDFSAKAVETVVSAFSVTVTTPPPSPEPSREPEKSGAAAEAGKKAIAKPDAAPKPKVMIAKAPAPKAASTGAANDSGASNAGAGTGAGGQGSGSGSGTGGTGQGGGLVRKAEKIAGEINSARDYPKATRDLRIDGAVTIYMTVGTDGRARNCRVQQASRDAEADAITCRLAEQRFRFKPATDAAGNPVESTYGWRQKWFYPKPGA
jgi:periplasmic protein TonB